MFSRQNRFNNTKHASTQMFSFEIIQRYILKMSFENSANVKIKFKSVNEFVKELTKLLNVFKTNLIHAQKQQIKYKNVRTKKANFEIKSYVNVNDKNIRIKRNKKFE